jgi:hypothetical protein
MHCNSKLEARKLLSYATTPRSPAKWTPWQKELLISSMCRTKNQRYIKHSTEVSRNGCNLYTLVGEGLLHITNSMEQCHSCNTVSFIIWSRNSLPLMETESTQLYSAVNPTAPYPKLVTSSMDAHTCVHKCKHSPPPNTHTHTIHV